MKKCLWFGLLILISSFYSHAGTSTNNIGGALSSGKREAVAKPMLTITSGGTSEYVIVVPDEETNIVQQTSDHLQYNPSMWWPHGPPSGVKQAANLLQSVLAEAAGCKLPVFKEAEAPGNKPHIYLGRTRTAKESGVPVETFKEWTFCKRAVGENLFLAGLDAPPPSWVLNDPSANVDVKWYGTRGTLKAVISFLEDEVGVRFLLPGTNGIYVPKLVEIKVDAELNVTAAPEFLYCGARAFFDVYDIANNYFPIVYFYNSYGGHSYYSAVPVDKYAKTHPEYFALLDGNRDPNQDNHLCISNPDVQELMLKEMEKQFDLGYEWLLLAQTDGYRPCECDQCKAIAGDDRGEALWIVHRKLAEEMEKRRPGKKVVLMAYGPTAHPPKTFDKFPDNVVAVQMCSYGPENFKEWEKFHLGKIIYAYNWGFYQPLGFLPKRTPRFAAEQLRLFAANNVRGISKDSFGEAIGLEGPVYYVYGKLLFNPDADPLALANDFYRAAYGKAYAPMKMLFDAMHKRLEEYPHIQTTENLVCYFFPPELILLMDENLKRAFKMDDDPRVQARLRLVEREFLYLKNIVSIFTYYRAYQLSGSLEAFDLLDTELNRRNALIDSWYVKGKVIIPAGDYYSYVKGKMIIPDGWPQFFQNVSKEFLMKGGGFNESPFIPSRATFGAPFTWNMKQMRDAKKNVEAGGGKINPLKITRLNQPVTLDGMPDEEAWKKAGVEELGEVCLLGKLKEGTSFRVACDDKNLYFLFVCKYADIEQAKFTSFSRDGNCCNDECLEIFLDPLGTREKYYHFIFNPVAGSFYEARLGFIEDPVHPLFAQEDPSWNGAWEYVVKIDKENKRWTAEVKIPFATLDMSAPKPGTQWTMNIGREHYYMNKETGKKDCELSLWSPNLKERGFCAPSSFGTVTFE